MRSYTIDQVLERRLEIPQLLIQPLESYPNN